MVSDRRFTCAISEHFMSRKGGGKVCQKYSFPLRYFAALPSFFWTREGSVDNSPFPPSLLSFFSAREGLFSHNIVCQNKEQRFPPLFPPAASSSPCNGQYLPKLKGKMAMGRKMTREIPLPPPEGREGGRGRGGWINNQGSESDDSWIFPFLFRKKVGD